MGTAGAARKLASAAAYGGGGLSVLGAGLYGLLRAEAKLARRAIGETTGAPPDATGWYGRGRPGPAIKVALLGDSSAAGYGVERVTETTGAYLASGLAESTDRRVHLRSYAVVGARSSDLVGQIDRAVPTEPHVAVILIGANDVTHSVLPSQSVRHLSEAVRRLRDAGVEVVVGTCPDLGTIKPIAPPLKQVGRAWSHRLAAAQTIAVVEEGGRTVSLASILGPEFEAAPALLFGPGPLPPVGRRLPPDGRHAAAVDARRARLRPRGRGRARGLPRRGRAARHHGGRRGREDARVRRWTAPRSAARAAACAVCGSRCGTAGGRRPPPPRAPRTTRTGASSRSPTVSRVPNGTEDRPRSRRVRCL